MSSKDSSNSNALILREAEIFFKAQLMRSTARNSNLGAWGRSRPDFGIINGA